MLLDPSDWSLASEADAVMARLEGELASHTSTETHGSALELRTDPHENVAEGLSQLEHLRGELARVLATINLKAAVAGLHPFTQWQSTKISEGDRYRFLYGSMRELARREPTFALHVHVAVPDPESAMLAANRLRSHLPLLLALSANSPFLDGRLAGLHSARSQTFTRSFPRCGVPYAFGGWPAFRDYIALLIRTQSIIEFTQIWWSVRPHFDYGTVEVRICDVQCTSGESDALAGLIVACAAQALLEVDSGVAGDPLPGYLIEENIWRAIRHGLDGRMIDFESGREYPSSEIAERLLAWTAPARAAYGLELSPLGGEANGAQRQRAMIDAGASMREAFEDCVRDTRATYSEEVRA